MDRCILFDIDGTLIDAGRAGSMAMVEAFRRLYDIDGAFEGVAFSGMTDLWILDQAVAHVGLPPFGEDGKERDQFFKVYLEELHRFVHGEAESLVHPGVHRLLDLLREAGAKLALATGNVVAGAREKLSPHGLNDYFPVGGFGDDHRQRARLTGLAAERAETHYGCSFAPGNVVVIGDSVYDVRAARDNGFHSVVVCTGWTAREELLDEGPDLIFDDFSDPEPAAASILGCCHD
jgi:phosphoglycolate phosphatase-like HAD superfamily hydrolase